MIAGCPSFRRLTALLAQNLHSGTGRNTGRISGILAMLAICQGTRASSEVEPKTSIYQTDKSSLALTETGPAS